MLFEYDAHLSWNLISRCNLDCKYCYTFGDPSKKTGEITRIDISSLMKTIDKTGKIFNIHFIGGGEPFLVPNIVDACIEITKRHYVGFNSNMITNKIEEFAEKIDPGRVSYINASCHIKELERVGLLDTWIDNFLMYKDRGFNIGAEEVAFPPLLKEAGRYRRFFRNGGIELKFVPFSGEYNGKKYPRAYTKKEMKIFGIPKKGKDGTNKYNQYGKRCNAGYNFGFADKDGNIQPCPQINESIGNLYGKIEFQSGIRRCPFDVCWCPLNVFDPHLFKKAVNGVKCSKNSEMKSNHISKFISFIKNM